MKRCVLLILGSYCVISCMQKEDVMIYHHAQELIDSVLHPKNRCAPDAAIDYIKEILQDTTLAKRYSQKVKQALIHILSKIVLECHFQSTGPSSFVQQKIYFDGTASFACPKKLVDESDTSLYETMFPKPSSPWHKLSFEEFVQEYCLARAHVKPTVNHALLSTCYGSLDEYSTPCLSTKRLANSW